MTPEGKVKATVRKFLRELGAYTFPVNQQVYRMTTSSSAASRLL